MNKFNMMSDIEILKDTAEKRWAHLGNFIRIKNVHHELAIAMRFGKDTFHKITAMKDGQLLTTAYRVKLNHGIMLPDESEFRVKHLDSEMLKMIHHIEVLTTFRDGVIYVSDFEMDWAFDQNMLILQAYV